MLLACTLAGAPRTEAGAWTQARGGFYQKVEFATLTTDEEYDAGGRRVGYVSGLTAAEYSRREVRYYGELGLDPDWTAVASLAWQTARVSEKAARLTTRGFSDIRLGIRRGLTRGAWVSSLALEVKIPSGYQSDDFPALGTGQPDAGVALQLGSSLGALYGTAEAGYRSRGGAPHDEIPLSAEVGWSVSRRLQLRGTVRGRIPRARSGEDSGATIDPASSDSRELDLQGAMAIRLTPAFDLETAAVTSLAGRRSLARTEFAMGLAWHR